MKKFLLLFSILNYLLFEAFPQRDSLSFSENKTSETTENKSVSTRLPQKGDVGFTLNFIGLLDTISIGSFKDHIGNDFFLMRYYIDNKSALRLSFGMSLKNEKKSWVDIVNTTAGRGQEVRDSTYKRTDFFISPGYEIHFVSGKNLDPYLAAAVQIGKIGRTKIRDTSKVTDTTGESVIDYTFNKDGGYLLGMNLISGFNYFFSEKISIGAEFGFGINTARYGGDWEEVTIDTKPNGTQSVIREIGSESVNQTKMKVNSMAGIMLSYFF